MLNGVATHYRVEAKKDTQRLVFTFSSPVNPMIATEPGHLRMSFNREPLLGSPTASYDGRQVAFSEQNGAAEVEVTTTTPLIASFSNAGRTITLTSPAPPTPPALAATPTPIPPMLAPSTGETQPARPEICGGDRSGTRGRRHGRETRR